jgi:hypothetical protein
MAAALMACVFAFTALVPHRDLVFSLLFLVALPLLAYPLQPLVPGFRGKGREGQRNLAIVMAVVGYVAGLVYAVAARSGFHMRLIFLTYLLSGLGIFAMNKGLRIRASGHACGIVGPLAMLFYVFGPVTAVGLVVPAVVYWASVKMGRHTAVELLWGSLIPLAAMAAAYGLAGI